ncbi:MAG: hypothetical protein IKI84_11460 [Clostridia bacterium]|nr:hypothetical protein [Clostridia bacterium]
MGQIKIITCPKCGAEIRREKPGHAFFRYGPPAGEFWLKFSDELFTHPSYEAREPGAVEYVVRRILSHYGVNGNNITVQTEYRSKDLKNENGTLGSFAPIGRDGGVIKTVHLPDERTGRRKR